MLRRYSLRTALILFAMLALLMATVGRRYAQSRAQRAALDQLASLSGITGFRYDWQVDGHVAPKSNPNYIDKPSKKRTLRKLFGQDFNDEVVEIEVHEADVSDDDLAFLKSFPRLRMLQLASMPINGECLQNVAGCNEMETLLITFAPLKDDHLRHVSNFRELQHLRLHFTPITDAGLKHIAKLINLRHVDLASTKISDAGLVHLSGLKKLETLILCDTEVTDAGLPSLYPLENLQGLTLTSNGFSDDAIERLETQLPNCKLRFFTNANR